MTLRILGEICQDIVEDAGIDANIHAGEIKMGARALDGREGENLVSGVVEAAEHESPAALSDGRGTGEPPKGNKGKPRTRSADQWTVRRPPRPRGRSFLLVIEGGLSHSPRLRR